MTVHLGILCVTTTTMSDWRVGFLRVGYKSKLKASYFHFGPTKSNVMKFESRVIVSHFSPTKAELECITLLVQYNKIWIGGVTLSIQCPKNPNWSTTVLLWSDEIQYDEIQVGRHCVTIQSNEGWIWRCHNLSLVQQNFWTSPTQFGPLEKYIGRRGAPNSAWQNPNGKRWAPSSCQWKFKLRSIALPIHPDENSN